MYRALEREAASAGLPLNWPPRLPDTRTALSAAEWARRHAPAASDEFNRALFAAHFDDRLLDVPIFRVAPKDVPPPGVTPTAAHCWCSTRRAR